jgi:hypothetical protein
MQTENTKATEQVESTVLEKTGQETEAGEPQKWLWVEAFDMDGAHVGGTG